MEILIASGAAVLALLLLIAAINKAWREVVPTNRVHIVQSKKKTTSYGKGKAAGNAYFAWPSWFPVIGVTKINLSVSNFDLSLLAYEAYDQDKVPFVVDVTAFFRIEDTDMAAQRVSSEAELREQLKQIVQGAVRSILAAHSIDQIMLERDTFGDAFTKAVAPELIGWGVTPVKNLELMDINDTSNSQVIHNIMAKKKSHIEMESRVEVAKNKQISQEAEIQAQRGVDLQLIQAKQSVDLRGVEAAQIVGEKTAQQEQVVGIANEQARQEIAVEKATTAEKDMAVKRVNLVREAENQRDESEVNLAEANFKAAAVLSEGNAEAEVRQKIFQADGALEIRLKYQMDSSIGVAQALASGSVDLVPEVVINGGNSASGEGVSAMDTLAQLMTVSLAQGFTGDDAPNPANQPEKAEVLRVR